MRINIKTEKILSPSAIKKIIAIGISLRDKLENAEKGLISEYDETVTYTCGMSCYYNDYLYECKYTTTGNFDESKWQLIGDELSLIDKQTLASMINLSDEEIASLQSLISTEIRLDKCFSASDTYNRILNAENNCKTFTMEQLAKKMGASYKVVADTTGVDSTEFLYLIPNGSNGYNIYAYIDGSAEKISDTNINLDGYAKLSDLNNYYDKATSDGKFATITTVDGKVDKTSILSAISSTPSDDKLLSEKAVNDTLVKKADITTTIDISSTDDKIPSAKAIYNKSKNSITSLSSGTDIKSYAETFGSLFITDTVRIMNSTSSPYGVGYNNNDFYYTIYNMDENRHKRIIAYDIRKNDMYMIMRNPDGWGTWKRVCSTSVADIDWTTLPLTYTDTSNTNTPTGLVRYKIKNGICYVNCENVADGVTGVSIVKISNMPPIDGTVNVAFENRGAVVGSIWKYDSTTLCVHKSANQGGYCSFSYPVAES